MFRLYLLFQYHRNQRNRGPLWWRLAAALLSLLFDRGFIAGGGGAGRRWGGSSFISLWGTGLLMALSNLTRVCFSGEKERRLKVTAGRRQPTFIQGRVFFFFPRRCHDAPRFLYRTMFIFWYTCGVVVLYSPFFLFNFLHFNMYPSLMTSTDPGNALFSVFCQNEYWAILTGKMRWLGNERKCGVRFSFLKFSQVTWQVDLLISKEATSQNKAFCTSPQWNICLFLFSLFAFPFLFSYSSIFFGMVLSLNMIPLHHSKYWEQGKVSAHLDL